MERYNRTRQLNVVQLSSWLYTASDATSSSISKREQSSHTPSMGCGGTVMYKSSFGAGGSVCTGSASSSCGSSRPPVLDDAVVCSGEAGRTEFSVGGDKFVCGGVAVLLVDGVTGRGGLDGMEGLPKPCPAHTTTGAAGNRRMFTSRRHLPPRTRSRRSAVTPRVARKATYALHPTVAPAYGEAQPHAMRARTARCIDLPAASPQGKGNPVHTALRGRQRAGGAGWLRGVRV